MYFDDDKVVIPAHDILLPDVLQLYIDRLKQQARLRRNNEAFNKKISEAEVVLAHVIATQMEKGAYLEI